MQTRKIVCQPFVVSLSNHERFVLRQAQDERNMSLYLTRRY